MHSVFRELRYLAVVFAAVSLSAACGGDDTSRPIVVTEPDVASVPDAGTNTLDVSNEPDAVNYPDVTFAPIPVRVDTEVISPVRAGELLDVTCRLFDANDEAVEPEVAPEFSIAVAPEGSLQRSGNDIMPTRVGRATVRCSAPELGLVDLEPESVDVLAGPPVTSAIQVDRTQMVAGETVTASCTFYDMFGNVADPAADMLEPVFSVVPSGGGIEVTGFTASIVVADVYTMSCALPGLTHEQSVAVEVVPGLPAELVISAAPNQPVYGLGQVVSINYIVTDQYGNVIPDAKVTTTVAPSIGTTTFGSGRFRFDEEGAYTVTVTVDGDTQTGEVLTRSVTIIVNGTGPSIGCDDPLDGSMVDAVPGQFLAFTGSVTDANGVQLLLVNGAGVTVNPDGTFAAPVRTEWGVNFVEIVATDQFGEENSRTCSFLASDYWSSPFTFMADSVILKLRQPAVDDRNVNDFDSLNDMLARVINSQGLVDEVHNALVAANPLQPFTCLQQSCIFGACICWFGYGVNYDNQLDVQGPNTTELDLITGGVHARARLEDLGVKVHVPYRLVGVAGSTRGWVYTDYIDVQLDIDLRLQNGQPRASIRPGSVSVDVGSVSTQFNGLDGAIVNLVIAVFENRVRGLIADTLRSFIEDSFDDVLDGVISSLDIDTLGSTFNVPRLDGSGTVSVRFNLQFSRVAASSSRFAIGIGTRFTPSRTENGTPTLGVAREHSSVWYEPNTGSSVLVGVYVGVLNHVLHALWRGGLFDATLTGADLGGGLPADATAVIQANLPPVVENLSDGSVRLSLGGFNAAITYPGFFDEPLNVVLGARATSSVAVQGDSLTFGGISVDELVFSTTDVALDATTRGVLETFLTRLVQSVVDTSLNQSLPALPIPSFTIPQSLSGYNLPGGAEFGIRNPVLDVTDRQYELEGTFGVR